MKSAPVVVVVLEGMNFLCVLAMLIIQRLTIILSQVNRSDKNFLCGVMR